MMHAFGPELADHRFTMWPHDLDLRLVRLGVSDYQSRVIRGLITFYGARDSSGDNTDALVWASGDMIARRIGAVDAAHVYRALRELTRSQAPRGGRGGRGIPGRPPLLGIATKGARQGDATTYSLLPLHKALETIDVSDVFTLDRLLVSRDDNASDEVAA